MNKINEKPNFLSKYEDIIKKYLKESLSSYKGNLSHYIRNYFGWIDEEGNLIHDSYQGKAFRPSICMLMCEAMGGDVNVASVSSISIELVHNFSLIHDDIEDNDKVRRHKPTLWATWGIPKALVTGNSILALGNKELEKLSKYGLSNSSIFYSQKLLTESYLKMMEGQFLDISFEKHKFVNQTDYLKMIGLKTGALIECSVLIGAVTSGKKLTKNDLDNIQDFGKSLGLLFQIRDDILGVWGTNKTGKPVGADIRKKKKSLPIILALSENNIIYKNLFLKIMEREVISDDEIQKFIEIMEKIGIKDKCEHMALSQLKNIKDTLKKIPIDPCYLKDFNQIGDFLMFREV
tara:strand:- start:680 stop:1723 length:1044 start_codon:yes stop_codon:yes gene_type:complete